jgi:hypothetical protein
VTALAQAGDVRVDGAGGRRFQGRRAIRRQMWRPTRKPVRWLAVGADGVGSGAGGNLLSLRQPRFGACLGRTGCSDRGGRLLSKGRWRELSGRLGWERERPGAGVVMGS